MKTFNANSTDLKTFQLLENDIEVGKLYYEKWYSFNAKLEAKNQIYDCHFKGIWGTELQILNNGEVVGTFKTNWLGKIIIEFKNHKYLLTPKGFLKHHYILLDEKEQEIASIRPDFDLKKLRYNYKVETVADIEPMLLLAIVHCINYQMSFVYMGTVALPV